MRRQPRAQAGRAWPRPPGRVVPATSLGQSLSGCQSWLARSDRTLPVRPIGPTGTLSRSWRYMDHLLAVPLLATPAAALGVDDAGAAATATRVFIHSELPGVSLGPTTDRTARRVLKGRAALQLRKRRQCSAMAMTCWFPQVVRLTPNIVPWAAAARAAPRKSPRRGADIERRSPPQNRRTSARVRAAHVVQAVHELVAGPASVSRRSQVDGRAGRPALHFANLRKSGLRFSFSALTPSRDSSVS
jgi:hypothetical protein